jgi:hypothetical protein
VLIHSVRQKKLIKNFGRVIATKVNEHDATEMSCIRSSPDKKYVFLGTQDGTLLKQINVHNHAVYDYGELPEGKIWAIAVTFDNKFVFFAIGKQLFQYGMHDQQMIARVTTGTTISTIVTSRADTQLWVGCEEG